MCCAQFLKSSPLSFRLYFKNKVENRGEGKKKKMFVVKHKVTLCKLEPVFPQGLKGR